MKFKLLLVYFLVTLSQVVMAEKLKVYAASSMTNAVGELIDTFSKNSGIKVVSVFGGSSSIARQIEHGAPVDVFISANTLWVDYLIEQKVINEASRTNIASNRLVVIQNKTLEAGEGFELENDSEWLRLLNEGRLAIGNTQSVPVGIYSKQVLENLEVWNSVLTSLAPVNNVRQVLALVERGETPLGIVYKTDALQSDKVRVIAEVDSSLHQQIVYPMVIVKPSKASVGFSAFVKSPQGKAILQHYGFDTL